MGVLVFDMKALLSRPIGSHVCMLLSCFLFSPVSFPPSLSTPARLVYFASAGQRENIWGPFLIISPASTLNNWHQEFSRFVPKFKVSGRCSCVGKHLRPWIPLPLCFSVSQTFRKPTELLLFLEQWKICFFFCSCDRLLHFWFEL